MFIVKAQTEKYSDSALIYNVTMVGGGGGAQLWMLMYYTRNVIMKVNNIFRRESKTIIFGRCLTFGYIGLGGGGGGGLGGASGEDTNFITQFIWSCLLDPWN